MNGQAHAYQYRKSEATRHLIREGIADWEQTQFEARYANLQNQAFPMPMTEAELRRVQPSLIDKLMPWIMVMGLIGLIALGTKLAEWVVTI